MGTPLQQWANEHEPSEDMFFKPGYWRQIVFVRDRIVPNICRGLDFEDARKVASVIATHRSKSIDLPVYDIERADIGLRLILRDNFYNWKLSVISERPIVADFTGLFYEEPPPEPEYTGDHLHPVYFEGFPADLIFGYYQRSDRKRWSAEVYGDESIWTVVYLIGKALGVVKPMLYHTKESHRKELDEQKVRRDARAASRGGR